MIIAISVLLSSRINLINKKKCLLIILSLLLTSLLTYFLKNDILYKILLIVKNFKNIFSVFFESLKISNL